MPPPDVSPRTAALRATFPLHKAIEAGDLPGLKDLLDQVQLEQLGEKAPTLLSQTLNTPNTEGLPPLHLAITKNNLDMVQALVEAGASLTQTDNKNHTPMALSALDPQRQWITDYLCGLNQHTVRSVTPQRRSVSPQHAAR